jgi:membrane protein CcdC involved in cytochrome C biogenesis
MQQIMLYTSMGVLIAYLYTTLVMRGSGEPPRIGPTLYPVLYNGMVIIPVSANTAVHIHHWMLLLPLTAQSEFQVARGFALGMVYQGLLYKDRFNIVENNPYN